MNSLTKFGKMFHLDVWALALWNATLEAGGLGVGTLPARLGALALRTLPVRRGPWRWNAGTSSSPGRRGLGSSFWRSGRPGRFPSPAPLRTGRADFPHPAPPAIDSPPLFDELLAPTGEDNGPKAASSLLDSLSPSANVYLATFAMPAWPD